MLGRSPLSATPLSADQGIAAYILAAAAGAYAMTGTAAGLRAARRLAASVGAYLLTGFSAILTGPQVLTSRAEREVAPRYQKRRVHPRAEDEP